MKSNRYAVITLFLFSSCATIINGSRQNISISSKPYGATVIIDDKKYGLTPVDVSLKRKRDNRHVVLTLEGYEPLDVNMTRKLDGWILGNLAIGVIPAVVDIFTGSMYHLSPNSVNVELKKNIK